MCLLISCPANAPQISYKTLFSGFKSNSSNRCGSGLAYCKDGEIIIKKGFFDFDRFYEAYKTCIGYASILHFRLSSGGPSNTENCHPFLISKEWVFAHNGILFSPGANSQFSDTYLFNEKYLKPIFKNNPELLLLPPMQSLLATFIKGFNRMAFLSNKSQIVIIGEEDGIWKNGSWFSNRGFDYCDVDLAPYHGDIGDETSIDDRGVSGLESTDPDDLEDEEELAMGLAWAHRTGRFGPSMRTIEKPETDSGYKVIHGTLPSSKILTLPEPKKENKKEAVLFPKKESIPILITPKHPKTLEEIKNHDNQVLKELANQGILDVEI